VLTGTTGIPKNIAAYFELIRDFKPALVISDFESWSYLYGQVHRVPVVSIDNMQVINRCTHSHDILEGHEAGFQFTRAFVKGKLPFCTHYVITSFFEPPLRKPKTELVPPILRPEILAAKRSDGEHLLVYQTAEGNEGLAQTLKKTGLECRVYGMKRDLKEPLVDDNLKYMPFSEQGFIDDLASSKGVIAGGGFTLMGEAVYLHKPMLAVPLERQFEQVLNARYLEKEGFGRGADSLRDPQSVLDFVRAIPECKAALSRYVQEGNTKLAAAVDALIDRAEAGLL
jgi:uncharacterized protein (TIGR00661 family)